MSKNLRLCVQTGLVALCECNFTCAFKDAVTRCPLSTSTIQRVAHAKAQTTCLQAPLASQVFVDSSSSSLQFNKVVMFC